MIVKIVKLSFLSLLLMGLIFPISILAITPYAGKIAGVDDEGTLPTGAGIKKISQIVEIARAVLIWIYYIFFIISVIYVVLAAYAYLGEGEDAEKLKSIHKQLMWAAIAIAVALISVGINAIIENFIKPGA